ncbi:hypothetical protein [Shewanella sp. NIFS-20-20]|uniref:hypothetical protein n=1 Tax=Shewanella sp. NIFS-20-20 TaxID=2853806 RepID=UPI001C494C26|nr:hypothetical protein [Shewanella sp. NIFS-20-20]MBV7317415.1 hypothetical protein [Shewanella sp. NIFS-20-20]
MDKWVEEIGHGIPVAIAAARNNSEHLSYIFKYAISHAIESMDIHDLDVIEEIEEYISELIDLDWSNDPESKSQYKFHYASTYIFAHVPAEQIEEMEADRIMDYVVEKLELFQTNA